MALAHPHDRDVRDFQGGDPDAELHPGRRLGPFELLAPVGAGGMAEVWVARRGPNPSDVFALKMLRPHLAENSAFREMFFDEARIASRIRHENVCATYDLVELDGVLALVMEWVDGSSLVRMLHPRDDAERVALPARHAVKIVAETAAGLHAAHELVGDDGRPLSVVHRDVSPHNVLVTRDGRVKVTDFGIAKALGKLHMTIAGQVKGKLAYMSPEQLTGAGVDRRSDVFALGTLLYEATTGERPFHGEHDPQVMSAIIMGNFDPPSAVVPGYPPALEEIVLSAMATEPGARYPSAFELGRALEHWLESSGPPVGGRQIALLVRERCSAELEARTTALSVPPPGTGPQPRLAPMHRGVGEAGLGAGTAGDRNQGSATGGVGVVGIAAAVLLGLTLGLGVLFYVRATRHAHAANTTATTSPPPSASPPSALTAGARPTIAGAPVVDASVRKAPEEVTNAGEIDTPTPAPLPEAGPPKPRRTPRSPGPPSSAVVPPNPYD